MECRPLSNGDLALLFFNNEPNTTSAEESDVLTCDQKCLELLVATAARALQGWSGSDGEGVATFDDASEAASAAEFDVYDLWKGSAKVASGNTTIYATVARGGSSVAYRLTKV